MENSQIATIQSLDISAYADLLTTFTAKMDGYKVQLDKAKAIPYTLESKPRFDTLKAYIKKATSDFEEARKPLTSQLNAVNKLFTSAENEAKPLVTLIDGWETDWKRSERIKQDTVLAAQAQSATRIRVIAEFCPKVEALLIDLVYDSKVSFLTGLERDEEPIPFQIMNDTWQGLCKRAMAQIGGTDFQSELVASIAPLKEELIIRYSKEALDWQSETLKSKGNKAALQAIGRVMGLAYSEAVVEITDSAMAAKVEAEMTIAETAQISIPEVVIGTKFIPQPANLREVQEIFRHWLTQANPSVEEAYALIGKAATMCKRDALKGTKWGGVTYIEDVK